MAVGTKAKGMRGPRMSGEERRAAILEAATRVFAVGGYGGATTAAIARASGITEPVLYHHFTNKAALYSACLDDVWVDLRERWDAAIAKEPDASRWLTRVAEAGFAALDDERDTARLWLHALADLADDADVGPRVVAFTTEIHEYVTDLFVRAQAAGGVDPVLEPRAEAWIFLSVGILRALSRRLGGIVEADFPSVMVAMQISYVPRS